MKLKVKHKFVTDYLVQRDEQVEALMRLLDIEASDVRFVGIHGMGGIGKTTLAKIAFNKICDRFEHCSFLTDVRELCQHKGIKHLQKKLLRDLRFTSGDIMHVEDGIMRMREMLPRKKVLIVLDDVDDPNQIRSLALAADARWFCQGSRIIITTRNQQVLGQGILTLEVETMKPDEALRLFSMHAFDKDSSPIEHLSLSKEAVKSSGRLPLALEVIGSHLRGVPHRKWAKIIERLKEVPYQEVQKKLLISYDSLSHGAQQIFLDIASFFIDHEKTNPMYMWEACKFDAEMGLTELIHKSLVKIVVADVTHLNGIVKEEEFWMHDQLRDLGRNIAKVSRIWVREDGLNLLREVKDRANVEMLRLCDNDYYYDSDDIDNICWEEFSGLKNLRYFECSGTIFSSNMQGLLPNLRWLYWRCCPVEFTGTGLSLRKLVILNVSWSNITEDWTGWSKIGEANNLKVLDLTGCKKLRRTPDLSKYSSLERLILEYCEDLVEIDRSIGRLKGLKFLNVNACRSLKGFPEELCSLDCLEVILGHPDPYDAPTDPPDFNFPESLGNLTSLLTLQFCLFKITKFPESIIRLSGLRHLSLTGIVELPQRVRLLEKLKILELIDCDMEKLPDSIGDMKSLVELNLSQSGITELPETIGNLEELRVIDLTESRIHKLPNSIGKLKRLEKLLVRASSLVEIPTTIEGCSSLRIMDLSNSDSMEKLPYSIGYLTSLIELDLSRTNVIKLPSSIGNLKELRMIRIDYSKIRELPASIGMLKKLEELSAVHCVSFREIPSTIGGCTSLRELKLNDCAHLKKLPDSVGNLRSLQKLDLSVVNLRLSRMLDLSSLGVTELPESIGYLKELRMLRVDGTMIRRLPASIGLLNSLQMLSASNCVSLEEIPSTIMGCTQLRELYLVGCENIQELPVSECCLRSLHILDLSFSKIIELPVSIGNLMELRVLRVDCTGIRRLPASIGSLNSLQTLSAMYCVSLEEIPSTIEGCTQLRELDLRGCKNIKELPAVSECFWRSLPELHLPRNLEKSV